MYLSAVIIKYGYLYLIFVLFCSDKRESITKIAKREIGLKIYEALIKYGDGKYADVVDTLYPARYKIYLMGGSIPQVNNIY